MEEKKATLRDPLNNNTFELHQWIHAIIMHTALILIVVDSVIQWRKCDYLRELSTTIERKSEWIHFMYFNQNHIFVVVAFSSWFPLNRF